MALLARCQIAYGTNEGSYQWGYKSGREGYESVRGIRALVFPPSSPEIYLLFVYFGIFVNPSAFILHDIAVIDRWS
jgi:hypothetical protein